MRVFRFSTGRDWLSWPVLLVLLAAFVPSMGVLWMLRAALESEQFAVRQRLADAYRAQLQRSTQDVQRHWELVFNELSKAGDMPPGQGFREILNRVNADGVIFWDEPGRPAYPNAAGASQAARRPTGAEWQRAERLEFAEENPAAAAETYGEIAKQAGDDQRRALAEQAQARCLLRAGDRRAGKAVLDRLSKRVAAFDVNGRSLAADAQLRLLELTPRNSAEHHDLAAQFCERLNDYGGQTLPADQRRFLMHRAVELAPEAADFPTLEAEDLAAMFLAGGTASPGRAALQPTAIDDVWSITTPDGRATALFRTTNLKKQLRNPTAEQFWPRLVTVTVESPNARTLRERELMAVSLAPTMPDWRVSLQARDGDVIDVESSRRRTLLLTIATALVGLTLGLTCFVAYAVRRQMQLARLKNDLVATVSHELKTPLASIRLLVDTLLDRDGAVDREAREYLELISHENERLTRLIENFLTFSRMERGRQRFIFEPIDVREVIDRAVAAVADRFNGVAGTISTSMQGPLGVRGDAEALVAALVNLFDNAWKYGGEFKQVVVSGRLVADRVVIEVQDNGIGLTPKAARRAFERFYQADQRLSRAQGGCGLGLSIVKSIVTAHGGCVTVASRRGEGSTFRVSLPVDQQATAEAAPHRTPIEGPAR